jgi:hypothetical protein
MVQGLIPSKVQKLFPFLKHTVRLLGLPSYIMGTGEMGALSSELKEPGNELDHSFPVPRLRMSAAMPLLLLYAFMVCTDTPLPSCVLELFSSPHAHSSPFYLVNLRKREKVTGLLMRNFIIYTVY